MAKAKKARRTFDSEFKRQVVEEAKNHPGKLEEFLKSKGVTTSHYYQWAKALQLEDANTRLGSVEPSTTNGFDDEISRIEIERLTLMLSQSIERENMFREQLNQLTEFQLKK